MRLVFGNGFDTKKSPFQIFRNISVFHFTILWLSFTVWIEEEEKKTQNRKKMKKTVLWCCKLLDHLLLDLYVRISCCRLGSFHSIFEIVSNLYYFFFTSHFSFRHSIDDDHVLHCITCLWSMLRVFCALCFICLCILTLSFDFDSFS